MNRTSKIAIKTAAARLPNFLAHVSRSNPGARGSLSSMAADYPGFGQSAAPDHATFAYTFAHPTNLIDGLLGQLDMPR
jgi:hypothetical protein